MFRLRVFLIISFSIYFSFVKAQVPSWVQKDLFNKEVFLKNEGQCNGWGKISDPVLYSIDNGADQFQLTAKGMITKVTHFEEIPKSERKSGEDKIKATDFFVQMRWLGSNPNVLVEAIGQRDDYFTYVLHDINTGITKGVKTNGYKKIIYHDLYPGIDAEYSIPEGKGGLKYSLIVHPGADLSQVRLQYSGDFEVLYLDTEANLFASLPKGEYVKEHAPKAWYQGNTETFPCQFKLQDNILQFEFPKGYNSSQALIIDPWVVNGLSGFPTKGLGYDVGYDNEGNLYVYGDDLNLKVSKYSSTGVLQWTFNGVLLFGPLAPWSSGSWPSNFWIVPQTGQIYIGQGFVSTGTRVVRLSTAGMYDNFISVANPDFKEIWDFSVNCDNGRLFALGGSPNSNWNLGIVDTISGILSVSNITSTPNINSSLGQDVVCGAVDEGGNLFVVMTSSGTPSINNFIYKANSSVNGYDWRAPSGYTTFNEVANKNQYPANPSCGFNCLAVNANYLFYYNGKNLKAFDKASGVPAGTPLTIPTLVARVQGGICVDECNNVYVGGKGKILMYSFDGNTFSSKGDIPLGSGLTNKSVYDLRYLGITNSLYASGQNFVGMYTAVNSASCLPITVSASTTCSSAVVTVTTTIANPNLTYTWFDAQGNKVDITSNTQNLTDTADGLVSNTSYIVQVQHNHVCGGFVGSFTITTSQSFLASLNTQDISCYGLTNGSISAAPIGGTPDYTYQWSNAETGSAISNLSEGIYTVTLTESSGCVAIASDTIKLTNDGKPIANFSAAPQPTTLLNATIFFTDQSQGASTWDWSFGDKSSTSAIQHPNYTYDEIGIYTVTLIVTSDDGCMDTTYKDIIIHPEFVLFVPNSFTPNGDNINDFFTPQANGIELNSFEMYIYDRWGNLIYSTRNIEQPWNGKANGGTKLAQQDTYVWKIKVTDTAEKNSHQYIGKITLIR